MKNPFSLETSPPLQHSAPGPVHISDLRVIPHYTLCDFSQLISSPLKPALERRDGICRGGDTAVPLANEMSIEWTVRPQLEGSAAVYALTL